MKPVCALAKGAAPDAKDLSRAMRSRAGPFGSLDFNNPCDICVDRARHHIYDDDRCQ